MLSAVMRPELSYPATPTGVKPVHQRFVHSGPLVLGAAPLNFPTPTADRDRTVSRRSKPSSRTTLNGEQPYPWDLLQPQDCDEPTSQGVLKHRRRYELLGDLARYPRSTFYPLSDGPSIQNHRMTKTYFRTCSSRHFAVKYPYAFTLLVRCPTVPRVPSCPPLLFRRRPPSQTTHHTLSLSRITGLSYTQHSQGYLGWLHTSWRLYFLASHLSYTVSIKVQCKTIVRFTGSFR